MGDGFAAGFLPHLVQVCSGAYYLMYLFFDRVQSENGARYEEQMSNMQVSALRSRMEAVKAAALRQGVRPGIDPFMTLSFLALPVIPALRLTTRGIFDVTAQRYL